MALGGAFEGMVASPTKGYPPRVLDPQRGDGGNTASPLGRLRERKEKMTPKPSIEIDAIRQRRDAELAAVEQRRDAEMDALWQRYRPELDAIRQRRDAEIDAVRQRLSTGGRIRKGELT